MLQFTFLPTLFRNTKIFKEDKRSNLEISKVQCSAGYLDQISFVNVYISI
jgi:hypothetical protein